MGCSVVTFSALRRRPSMAGVLVFADLEDTVRVPDCRCRHDSALRHTIEVCVIYGKNREFMTKSAQSKRKLSKESVDKLSWIRSF